MAYRRSRYRRSYRPRRTRYSRRRRRSRGRLGVPGFRARIGRRM